MSNISSLHIERERTGYIAGKTYDAREEIIDRIWKYIRRESAHFRAPGHHPVSSPELVSNSHIQRRRSELHIDHKPGRNILYLNTLSMDFKVAKIQMRLEVKQKQSRGELKQKFNELTVKIGDKADQRIEEAVRINFEIWEEKGFYAALNAGIEAGIKRTERLKGKEAAKKVRKKYKKFKKTLKSAYEEVSGQKFSEIDPRVMGHINRDTMETEYSPRDCHGTILEVKTDNCDWETVLGQTGDFAQIEIEHIKGGDIEKYEREMKDLISHQDFNIHETEDSKEDNIMREMVKVLLPQDNSEAEEKRIVKNREILEEHLQRYRFVSLSPEEHGIKMRPL